MWLREEHMPVGDTIREMQYVLYNVLYLPHLPCPTLPTVIYLLYLLCLQHPVFPIGA
jgi:hypothetical protein